MFAYIIKRVLLFIPTFFIISLVAFTLSKFTPGDPVELRLSGGQQAGQSGQSSQFIAGERAYRETAERYGFHLPNFYFAFSSAAEPDTLYRIVKRVHRENLESLIDQYGNWPEISDYYHSIKALEFAVYGLNLGTDADGYEESTDVRGNIEQLYYASEDDRIDRYLADIEEVVLSSSGLSALKPSLATVKGNYLLVKEGATRYKNYIPAITWYGFKNQYHRWISKFLVLDFGISLRDDRPVNSKIGDAVYWTLYINIVAIFLVYLLSIPIGVSSAVKKDSLYDRVTTVALFVLYSLPSFWIGVLILVFLTTPEYGEWTDWFNYGLPTFEGSESWIQRQATTLYYLIPALFCVTYPRLAFISRQQRGGILSVIRQDYIRTAKAKGLSQKVIIWKHAFRNSLLPMITIFASILPASIAGSLVIEIIFNIPGMGSLMYGGIYNRDYPVVFAILMIAAVLTMLGNLLADILYSVADPRITFTKK